MRKSIVAAIHSRRVGAAALCALVALGIAPARAVAADLVAIEPVSNRIVRLHMDDGHIDYFDGATGDKENNVRYHGPLDLVAAVLPASYSLSSSDDTAFAGGLAPSAVGRKTKGGDFHSKWYGSPDFILEHWIYIELPQAMTPGRTYTLTCAPGLVDNGAVWSFTFDPATQRSPTVHVSQLGFTPTGPKYVYLSQWMGDFTTATHVDGGLELNDYAGATFTVVRENDDAVVFSGPITKRKDKTERDAPGDQWGPTGNFTLADVYEGDFSSFTTPGRYRVVVERMGCSFPFEIHADVYRRAWRQGMRGLFMMRQGIVQEMEPGLEYPRDHHIADDGVTMYYDPDFIFGPSGHHSLANFDKTTRPITSGVWGWYHDAGDWDSYTSSHSSGPAGLLVLYNLKPRSFVDGEVGNRYKLSADGPWIDEGTNDLPDIIDEGRWYVDFLDRTRQALIDHGYGTGGVPGYVGVDAGADTIASWQDRRPMGCSAENGTSTYQFAGLAALLARSLNIAHQLEHPGENHPEYDSWITKAEAAWRWAEAWDGQAAYAAAKNVDPADVPTYDPRNERFAAALFLYAGTGDATYQTVAKTMWDAGDYTQRWNGVWNYMTFAQYAEGLYGALGDDHPGLDMDFRAAIRNGWGNKAAKELVSPALETGFRFGFWRNMFTAFGTFTTPCTSGVFAHAHNGDANVLDALHTRAAYHLGGNEDNLVHMTGLGWRRERALFMPDAWSIYDQDGPVYRTRMPPGHSVYMRARMNVSGDGDEVWAQSTMHPVSVGAMVQLPDGAWPYSERRNHNRMSISGSEFTFHQNNLFNIFTYGYLCADTPSLPDAGNPVPTVRLNISADATISHAAPMALTAYASEDTVRVDYYYDWHFIGTATDPATNFRCTWRPADTSAPLGAPTLLTAVAYDALGEISWQSAAGETMVTVVAETHVPVSGVGITGIPAGDVSVNGTYQLGADLRPSDHSYMAVLWTSSDPSVASVDHTGLVAVHATGTTTIGLQTADGQHADSWTLNAVDRHLTAISITGAPATLAVNAIAGLGATLTPADTSQRTVVWSSDDPAVASVDQQGVVTGRAAGTVTITASGAGGSISDSVIIGVVRKDVSGVAIVGAPSTMVTRDTANLSAVFTPADATDRRTQWASSDTSVISVDADGRIAAIGYGSAVITLTAVANGNQDAVPITVVPIYDGFAGTDGLDGRSSGIGWGGAWTADQPGVAETGSLRAETAPGIVTSGNRMHLDNSVDTLVASRLLPRTRDTGHTWMSALVAYERTGFDWAGSRLMLAEGDTTKIGFGITNSSTAQFFGSSTGGSWNTGYLDGSTHLVDGVDPHGRTALLVVHVDHAAAVVTWYYNPTPGADVATLTPLGAFSAADDPDLDASDLAVDRVVLTRHNHPACIITWDEIRIGESYAAVVPSELSSVMRRIDIRVEPRSVEWLLQLPADGPGGSFDGTTTVFAGPGLRAHQTALLVPLLVPLGDG